MKTSRVPSWSTSIPVTAVPASLVASLTARAPGDQRDVGVLEGGTHTKDLGVGLGVDQAREAVAGRAADAAAERRVGLVEHDATRGVEGVPARGGEVVGQLLDPRLVRQRRERIGRTGRRLGRVLAPCPVHLVELLGLGVVGLHVVVADRPGGREAVVVLQLAEVLTAQPVQRRPVQLGGAAHEVVDLGLERLALVVVPRVGGDVAVVDEHIGGGPVLRLAGQPVAPLQQQDALARRGQVAGQGAAAGAGPDDDDVVVTHP